LKIFDYEFYLNVDNFFIQNTCALIFGLNHLNLNEVSNHIEKSSNFKEQPLNNAIINTSYQIDDIPELHDRLIAGTAKYLEQELITNDPVIAKSKHVKTIWK